MIDETPVEESTETSETLESRAFGEQDKESLGQSVEETPTPEPEKEVPQTYTDEEFASLNTLQVEESKLTPSQRFAYNSARNLERAYQQKFQSLAEERRTLGQQPQPGQPPPEEALFAMYLQRPDDVIRDINVTLRQLRANDPSDDRIAMLEDFKDKLPGKAVNAMAQVTIQREQAMRQNAAVGQYWTQMKAEVPDYFTPEGQINETLRLEMRDFAKTKFGFTDAELDAQATVKNTKALYLMYKDHQAAQGTVKTSRKKKEPSKVETAGSGFETSINETKWGVNEQLAHMAKTRAGSFSGG